MVLDMLDVENVKTILQSELKKREKAKSKFEKYRSSGNRSLEEFYERRYNMYISRFDGMCDMLFDLVILVWTNDGERVKPRREIQPSKIVYKTLN